jgi:hypothetical protein
MTAYRIMNLVSLQNEVITTVKDSSNRLVSLEAGFHTPCRLKRPPPTCTWMSDELVGNSVGFDFLLVRTVL